MPLQKPNLHFAGLQPTGLSFEDFFGPSETRPGELHEPFRGSVEEGFRSHATTAGIPISLAVTVVVERELALSVFANLPGVIAELDRRSRLAVVNVTSTPMARYIRTLVALSNGQKLELREDATVVVPLRVGDRLRATGYVPALRADDLTSAIGWELAAAGSGQTIAEWAGVALLAVR